MRSGKHHLPWELWSGHKLCVQLHIVLLTRAELMHMTWPAHIWPHCCRYLKASSLRDAQHLFCSHGWVLKSTCVRKACSMLPARFLFRGGVGVLAARGRVRVPGTEARRVTSLDYLNCERVTQLFLQFWVSAEYFFRYADSFSTHVLQMWLRAIEVF